MSGNIQIIKLTLEDGTTCQYSGAVQITDRQMLETPIVSVDTFTLEKPGVFIAEVLNECRKTIKTISKSHLNDDQRRQMLEKIARKLELF